MSKNISDGETRNQYDRIEDHIRQARAAAIIGGEGADVRELLHLVRAQRLIALEVDVLAVHLVAPQPRTGIQKPGEPPYTEPPGV